MQHGFVNKESNRANQAMLLLVWYMLLVWVTKVIPSYYRPHPKDDGRLYFHFVCQSTPGGGGGYLIQPWTGGRGGGVPDPALDGGGGT